MRVFLKKNDDALININIVTNGNGEKNDNNVITAIQNGLENKYYNFRINVIDSPDEYPHNNELDVPICLVDGNPDRFIDSENLGKTKERFLKFLDIISQKPIVIVYNTENASQEEIEVASDFLPRIAGRKSGNTGSIPLRTLLYSDDKKSFCIPFFSQPDNNNEELLRTVTDYLRWLRKPSKERTTSNMTK